MAPLRSRKSMKPNLGAKAMHSVQLRHMHLRRLKEEKFVNINAKDKRAHSLVIKEGGEKSTAAKGNALHSIPLFCHNDEGSHCSMLHAHGCSWRPIIAI